jgi:ParB-like chromosome segregation protein Spo0J
VRLWLRAARHPTPPRLQPGEEHLVKTVELPIGKLQPHTQNARTHDLAVIKESLQRFGQYRAIVVQAEPHAGKHTILAGHGTWEAMRELKMAKVLVHLVDADAETAKRIMLMDNRANDRGGYDEQALALLLADMPTLDATGYEQADLDSLLAKLAGPADPDPAPQEIPETFDVIVSCESEDTQLELLERLTGEGLACKALVS